MTEQPNWRRYLRLWGPDPLRDVDDELEFHVEMKRQELERAGLPAGQVDEEITRAFGDRRRIEKELKKIGLKRLRRARRMNVMEELRVDLRHAWRAFWRRPAVPAVVVATLGLAIGAGTAVFSMIDAVVLNPLAVHGADEVVMLYEGEAGMGFSYPMVQHVREHSTSIAGLAASTPHSVAVRTAEQVEQLQAALVTGDYFTVLGLTPQLGRLLQRADEAEPGATPYVVVSDGYWRRALGSDPDVAGRSITVNEAEFTVVGVAPPRFRGTSLASPVDLWIPLTMVATVGRSGLLANPQVLASWYFNVLEPVARVRPGTTTQAALAELRTLHAAGWSMAPEQTFSMAPDAPKTLRAASLNEAAAGRSRDDLLRFLRMLAAAVAIALSVACVNVANLMLMRSTERQREISIRAAVGASRGRVIRQLLVESTALAMLAGALGAGVALACMNLLSAFALPGGISLGELSLPMDLRVLAFTLGLSLCCAVAFGLAPALSGSRTNVMDALRGGTDTVRDRWRGGNVLLAAQVGLSVILLVAGSLFVRSLQQALSVDLGFRSTGVGAVSVGLRQHGYAPAELDGFLESVLRETTARPGITRAAAATRVPLEPPSRFPVTRGTSVPMEAAGDGLQTAFLQVTPGYLDLLGLRVVRGRDIEWSDREGAPRVALVTESAARSIWPGEDPLGQPFVLLFGEAFTVVGIVADAHLTRLTDHEPHVILPLLQTRNLGGMDRLRLLAAGQDARTAIEALRAAVQSVDDRLPTFQERSVQQQVEALLMPQRFGSLLLSAFAVIALLISAVGVYAVAAYDVARRYREIGIRAALGAGRRQLVHIVVARAGAAICAGMVLGLLAAAYVSAAVRTLLFGITSYDAPSYAAAALLLGCVAALASWIPARRAARIDPMEVMRN